MGAVSAVIIAGGRATRMGTLCARVPKALLPINGIPLLEYHVRALHAAGITEVTVLAGHMGENILVWARARHDLSRSIRVVIEQIPAGTGGCLRLAPPASRTVAALMADVFCDIDLDAMTEFHWRKGSIATVAVHPNDHPQDSDLVVLDRSKRIVQICKKPRSVAPPVANRVVAGVFILEPEVMRCPVPSDLVHDVLDELVKKSAPVYAYETTEYLKDVGTPLRYESVQKQVSSAMPARMRRGNARPAAFLDRDGTINKLVGDVSDPSMLELLPGAARGIRQINLSGALALLATNQPVVAKGLCDERRLRDVQGRLEMLLGAEGAFIDGAYICMHHPEKGHSGEVPSLKTLCDCRKPATGLAQQALDEHAIDMARSAMFGDQPTDREFARALGIRFYAVGRDMPLDRAVDQWLREKTF